MPRPCDLCGATESRVWDTRNSMDVLVCEGCGFGWAEVPESHSSDLEERYDEGYYQAMGYDRKRLLRIRRARTWLRVLAELRQPPGNLLDIGCSLGYFLEAARSLGWTAYGTDISPHALRQTEALGFRVFHSTHPEEFPPWLPPLDAVSATHVVEHLGDPVGYLAALRQRMAPGGVLYVQLPNFAKLLRHGPHVPYVGPPDHAGYFTLRTAGMALEKAGWELVAYPKIRRGYVAGRPWRWVSELLYVYPRELLRERNTLSGLLSNLHIFARTPG